LVKKKMRKRFRFCQAALPAQMRGAAAPGGVGMSLRFWPPKNLEVDERAGQAHPSELIARRW